MMRADRNALIVLFGALALFGLFMALPAFKMSSSVSSKWNSNMPDDGTMLCSMAGEGFIVVNNVLGFYVDRHKAFDSECAKRVK
jgi:hypothetical protein